MSERDTNAKLFVTALKNAHAMEVEAKQIISRQLDRLEHYPDVGARLRAHLEETQTQIGRLDEAMASINEKASSAKDFVTGIVGNMAALGHVPMGDEILKNSFANFAFENFEIAAYNSLFTIGEALGETRIVSALQPSLDEEQKMAEWLSQNLPQVTRTYMTLRAAHDVDASH